ncbi:MAG TPA: hypothetical protein VK494_00750 [Gemmatimonadaceae bacterium]|nr:hypothetical protein [Gemmatimonadaceae bacterium]
MVAPNLSVTLHEYSTPQLEAIIRRGVRPNGRSVIIMPSQMFNTLSDQDLERSSRIYVSRTGPSRRTRTLP